jgi:hypothetical protein
MAIYAMLGMVVVAAMIGFGVYWLVSNVTFKRQPERYTYQTDEAGNEYVQDNSKGDEPNAKA